MKRYGHRFNFETISSTSNVPRGGTNDHSVGRLIATPESTKSVVIGG